MTKKITMTIQLSANQLEALKNLQELSGCEDMSFSSFVREELIEATYQALDHAIQQGEG